MHAKAQQANVSADVILKHSAEDLSVVADGSIGITVTSPPYWNAIDYDVHTTNKTAWYRTRNYGNGYKGYAEYLDWLEKVFRPLLAKTKPGGFCAVVVGTVLLNGEHYPLPFDFTSRMVGWGWQFHQDIVWHKVTGGVKRAGSFIQRPFPGYFYPNIMTEYILVFRKEGEAVYTDRSNDEKETSRIPIDDLFTKELANNVWHIAPVPPGHLDHPCPFPEEIPLRLMLLYSYPGDLVFDPFNGSGQTTKVARHLGRHFLGLDVEAKYVKYAEERLKEPLAIRAEQLLAIFEKLRVPVSVQVVTQDLPLFEEDDS
jgi:site-specific DNA-methyltransferase (adenine-specific)